MYLTGCAERRFFVDATGTLLGALDQYRGDFGMLFYVDSVSNGVMAWGL